MTYKSSLSFPLDKIDTIIADPDNYRLLTRVPYTSYTTENELPIVLNDTVGDEMPLVFLEMKTTGNHPSDKLIELAMVKVLYSPSANVITRIIDIYDEYQDPKLRLSPNIQFLTGITDEDLRNKTLDENRISRILADNPPIISHKAEVARPFFDSHFSKNYELQNLSWVSSRRAVDWHNINVNYKDGSLQLICFSFGYFFDIRDTLANCLTLIWALNRVPTALQMVYKAINHKTYIIYAKRAPIEVKDNLKAHDYRWHKEYHMWYKSVQGEEELIKEKQLLARIYDTTSHPLEIITINAKNSFKAYQSVM